ncbi:hypothetical protein CLF_105861 [Clonorchis sinensis]|uniref:Uncharacterized protein n=1 Tax=Clonorchis sinensis TaxID=79923 RepID=G7YEB9_CLOSI|nr:hypothetical protein CLF_105861 [Clonorchis sinensis]
MPILGIMVNETGVQDFVELIGAAKEITAMQLASLPDSCKSVSASGHKSSVALKAFRIAQLQENPVKREAELQRDSVDTSGPMWQISMTDRDPTSTDLAELVDTRLMVAPSRFDQLAQEGDSHPVPGCQRFLSIEVPDRWRCIREHNSCFVCLEDRHMARRSRGSRILAHLEVIPVKLDTPAGKMTTYAFLDAGSGITLVKRDILVKSGVRLLSTSIALIHWVVPWDAHPKPMVSGFYQLMNISRY